MNASTRAALSTGVAALSLGALAVVASIPPASMRTIQVVSPANFTADAPTDASGTPIDLPSEEDLDSALALIEQLAPVADGRVVTVTLDGHEKPATATIAPLVPNAGDSAVARGGSAGITGQLAADDPVAQNAASDLIDGVYSISRYWANYVSLELGPWLINWIPFGYLISDQIYIWYPNFVLPTVDSFVYDFLDPVVNNPLNPTVWIDGIGAMIDTASNGLVNGISDEINYIVTFGWFPIPLPPLPDFPLPGLSSESASSPATASAVATLSDSGDDTGGEGTGDAAGETIDTGTTDGTTTEGTDPADTEPADTEPADTEPADTEPADAGPSDTGSSGTGPADAGPSGTGPAEEATGAATGDGSAQRTTGEGVEAPADDADGSADVSGAEDADEFAAESGEKLGSAAQSGDAEQAGDDADSGKGVQQDSTPDSGEKSGDGDAAKASASEGN